jgi:hypothetical protein
VKFVHLIKNPHKNENKYVQKVRVDAEVNWVAIRPLGVGLQFICFENIHPLECFLKACTIPHEVAEAYVVLSKNKEWDKDYKQEGSFPVDCLWCSIYNKENHEANIL